MLFFDRDFFDISDLIGVHPNDNTATVWLRAKDLVGIIEEHGSKVEIVQI